MCSYSGYVLGGITMFKTSSINSFLRILSLLVVAERAGDELTSTSHGLRLLSIIIS